MTSTKKQKRMISRSIVDKIHTRLNLPGRFLEKKAETGLWHEVVDKRVLDKTTQALREGAAPLRKELLEDMSDPAFLDALFDGGGSGKSSLGQSLTHGVSGLLKCYQIDLPWHFHFSF